MLGCRAVHIVRASALTVIIGTAGWSIPRKDAPAFPAEGTALQRYSQVFRGVEVNSSFHRPHRTSTWAKWAASVPEQFRFAVKIPKSITHQAKLVDADEAVSLFAEQVAALGGKLALLLVQLPPKLSFDLPVAERFFTNLGRSVRANMACEPRHPTWFENEADTMLKQLKVARVAADPALGTAAAIPGGWRGLSYWRLHGSPTIYRSSYTEQAIDTYAGHIRAAKDEGVETWCVFDNTAASAATSNALSLRARI
jgi:uncharacterized protein YecE (DUF72 family)